MERLVKPKLITCSLLDQIKDKKKMEKSRQSRMYAHKEPLFAPENQQPLPLIQMLLEESKPQNARLLRKRFTAQKRQKVSPEDKPKHRSMLRAENTEPDNAPDLHLPPIQDTLEDSSPKILIRPEEDNSEASSQYTAASPPTPPPHTHHYLDKNFVRMLKEKQIRALVDAENAEMIALKLKCKKSRDLENMINEKKMHFKCDEGERWQEQVELRQKLETNSLATFWAKQNKIRNLINRQEAGKQQKKEKDGFSHMENGQDPDNAQHFVYKQLADIKIKKAASRALLEEKQYIEAVTTQRNAEDAKEKREEKRRLAAVGEFRDFIHKAHYEKETRKKANRQLEKEETSHKMKVFEEKDDVQKCLLREHHKGAREIQNEYAKVINDEFEYKQSKKRILCHAPIVRDAGPQRKAEWPYLTRQGNYMETITGAPLSHKRKPQSSSRMFLPQKLCLTTESYTCRN